MTGVLPKPLFDIHNAAYDYSHKLLNDLYAWQRTRKRINLHPLGLTRQAFKSLHHWYKKEVMATVQMRYPLPGIALSSPSIPHSCFFSSLISS
jgi:hypothetical protein